MFGDIITIIALITAIYSVIRYYQASNGNNKALKHARIAYHTTTALIIIASIFLLFIIVNHQYQYKYVFDYSNAELSPGLLLSTFYAGQEGSFMLWLLLAVIIGAVLQNYTSKRNDLEPSFMMVYSLIIVYLIIMVTPLFKSPFTLIWTDPNFISIKYINQAFLKMPIFQSFLFSDPGSNQEYVRMSPQLMSILKSNSIPFSDFLIKGKGLNPLLQNFWMEVHPPILFLGYALSAVPFSFAVSALIKNKYTQWVKLALPWTVTTAAVLGLGLMIGGYWAYGVLGWGGFWGWDPVENASLIPWVISVALIHTLLIQKQTQILDRLGRFAKTNLTLGVLVFILVLYSTFLTRSGILSKASVHSFEDPGETVYLFLILFISTFTIAGIGGILFRRKSLTGSNENREKFLSRESGLLYGALFLVASALVVFVGTSSPIIGSSVEISFYNKMNLPLVIIMCLLIGFTLYLRWKETNRSEWVKSFLPALLISLIITIVISFLLNIKNISYHFLLLSIIFTVVVNIQMLTRVIKSGIYFWGGHLSHIGFALFLFGVLVSSTLERSQQVDLPIGVKTHVFNVDLTFTGPKLIENSKDKYTFNININENNKMYTATPVMFYSNYNNSLMREPYILEGFAKDIYFSPISYVDNSQTGASNTSMMNRTNTPAEILTVEVSTKPFISFVWLGVLVMSIGLVLVIIRRTKVNKSDI